MEIRRATKGPRPGWLLLDLSFNSVKALQLLNFTAGVTTRPTRHWNFIVLQVTRSPPFGRGQWQHKLNFYLSFRTEGLLADFLGCATVLSVTVDSRRMT